MIARFPLTGRRLIRYKQRAGGVRVRTKPAPSDGQRAGLCAFRLLRQKLGTTTNR